MAASSIWADDRRYVCALREIGVRQARVLSLKKEWKPIKKLIWFENVRECLEFKMKNAEKWRKIVSTCESTLTQSVSICFGLYESVRMDMNGIDVVCQIVSNTVKYNCCKSEALHRIEFDCIEMYQLQTASKNLEKTSHELAWIGVNWHINAYQCLLNTPEYATLKIHTKWNIRNETEWKRMEPNGTK